MKYEVTDGYFTVNLHVDCEKEVDEEMSVCPHCNSEMGEDDMFYRIKPILMLLD
jgi:uncharacterized protein with PIN domain